MGSAAKSEPVSAALAESELARIDASDLFRRSPRHRRLLRHLVLRALAGEAGRLKESMLAAEVFGIAPARFDAARESIVRVEARRLRQKLARYYQGEGAQARLVIRLEPGSYVPRLELRADGGAAELPSLAILPFLDLVGDPDGRRRGEGLAEELVDALVQVPGLKVVARTSAFRFGNAAQDVREIARELGVQTVLEGSIAAARDGYRVIAQLVGGADGMHLWSHAFEAESHELATLVPRLARSVASGLRLGGGSASVLRRAAQRISGDAAAREAFHRGKYLLGRHSLDGYRRALACFDEALARDGEFALAWTAKAQAHIGALRLSAAPSAADIEAAHAAVSRALEIDPELGAAHSAAATLAFSHARDWVRAERAALEAIRYAPGSAYVHHSYAMLLMFAARFDEAQQVFAVARELDPLDPQLEAHELLLRFYRRDFRGAAAGYGRLLDMEPGNIVARVLQATSMLCAGETAAARHRFEAIAADLPQDSIGPLGVLQSLAQAGESAAARATWTAMVERFGVDRIGPYRVAMAYARLGEVDAAFEWLRRAAEARDMNVNCTAVDPTFDGLRDDARWTELLRELRLPQVDPRCAD